VKAGTQGQASVYADAAPTVLYDMVSDVARMGEWSPECRYCEWIGGATGPAVGARFKGSNRRGLARWSTKPRVVAAQPGREFAFVIGHLGRDMTRWSYRFEPTSGGTTVTESFEMVRDLPWYFRLFDRLLMRVADRKTDLETNMGETLRRLKAAAEAQGPGR
jgi:Polyketide cyclase / dehydrase and lipid transport